MLLYLQTFFMSCIFIEIQACKNEYIPGCLKILNTISRKKVKKDVFFYLKIQKKKFQINLFL